jgi:hypothetical protein
LEKSLFYYYRLLDNAKARRAAPTPRCHEFVRRDTKEQTHGQGLDEKDSIQFLPEWFYAKT